MILKLVVGASWMMLAALKYLYPTRLTIYLMYNYHFDSDQATVAVHTLAILEAGIGAVIIAAGRIPCVAAALTSVFCSVGFLVDWSLHTLMRPASPRCGCLGGILGEEILRPVSASALAIAGVALARRLRRDNSSRVVASC